jgi:hypothetical protein
MQHGGDWGGKHKGKVVPVHNIKAYGMKNGSSGSGIWGYGLDRAGSG